jgi:hypothetical protein
MNLQYHRSFVLLVLLAAAWMLVPATSSAQLLPPGDFNGKSFNQWGLDYAEWSAPLGSPDFIVPDPSRQDAVNGVRYLPVGPIGVREFVTNLTIDRGTALFGSPFYFYGERYDDGHSDDPADPLLQTILDGATLRATLDGVVLLEGTASSLAARHFGPSYFSEPIPYTTPQQRGPDGSPFGQGLFSIASAWTQGIGTMYASLPRGEHTLRTEFNSEFFGGAFSNTYHISVVPEPATVVLAGCGSLGLSAIARRRRRHDTTRPKNVGRPR